MQTTIPKTQIKLNGIRLDADSRRHFLADLFPTPGDVNVVYLHAKEPIAWHRHQKQTDYIFCARGLVTVGIVPPDSDKPEWHVLDDEAGVLEIPPNHWHGYMQFGRSAVLVSYITQKYNPDDEERAPISQFPWPRTHTR